MQTLIIAQRILVEFILDFFYFPIWWYTGGAKKVILFCAEFFLEANSYLAPGLWLRNILTPMYGQYDWQGRIMSFFMRLANVVIRFIGLFIWLLLTLLLFFIWMITPIFVVWRLLIAI